MKHPATNFWAICASVALLAAPFWIAVNASEATNALSYVVPTSAALTIFAAFTVILRGRVGDNLFAEIGFIYVGLIAAYTVVPGLTFITGSLGATDPLSTLSPTPSTLVAHLWRQVLFMFSVAAGYLLFRGARRIEIGPGPGTTIRSDAPLIVFLICLVVSCIAVMALLSAPVTTYWDNYTRYDHLPWLTRKLVSICIRLKAGIYSVLIVLLFLQFRRYRWVIPFAVGMVCVHEVTYSMGARIEAYIVLLQALCLYAMTVKAVTLKKAAVVFVPMLLVFSLVETVRVLDFNVSTVREMAPKAIGFPAELGAVYYTGFHLYGERAQQMLPPHEWPMFFSDFISVVTPGDFLRWNPMSWYHVNYYPYASVPPFTLGPIADSAIWGGEVDLAIRGLVNGVAFAALIRWFVDRRNKWWALMIYAFCCATSVMTLKYGVFYHLTPLVKTLLPTLAIVAVFKGFAKIWPGRRMSTGIRRAGPHAAFSAAKARRPV